MSTIKKEAQKEQAFVWRGKDQHLTPISGEIFAVDLDAARNKLRKQGINANKLSKKAPVLFSQKNQKITSADIAMFARQLATMLHAGIPIVQSIDIIGRGHENKSMHFLLLTLKTDVENGESLAYALSKHPSYFDSLFCNLIKAGEHAGVLESLLDKIATYKEKSEAMQQKIKKALVYPVSVMVIAFMVTMVLLVVVVPVFEDLFQSFGADLPPFTKLIIAQSKWMQHSWWAVVLFLVAVFYGLRFFKRTYHEFNLLIDKLLLTMPIVGKIIHQSEIARFTRTLSTLSTAGVPLVEALKLTTQTSSTLVYRDVILQIREDVESGQRLHISMRVSSLFPYIVEQMVAIGEESGTLDNMLSKIADVYEEKVTNLIDNLSSLIEPVMMSVVGVLVGGLIVAMYLPVFKLGGAIH
jgi:type IV pilus assembly protein PilC